MSPLWRDEVTIYVAPTRVALARRGRGLRPRIVATADARVMPGSAADVAPALGVLAGMLEEPSWRDANARVIVADAWARFALVPWGRVWLDGAERLGQARYALADAYGDVVKDWTIAVAEPVPGRASLVCGLRPDVLSGLGALLPAAGLRLTSLRPWLVCAFNAWRRVLPGDAWFVAMDETAIAAVHIVGGTWQRVHMLRGGDHALELRRLQAFGDLAAGAQGCTPMYVAAPRALRETAARDLAGVDWLDVNAARASNGQELVLLQRACA